MAREDQNTEETAESKGKIAASRTEEPEYSMYSIAAGLLWQDRKVLLPLYLLLVLPMICGALLNLIDPRAWVGLKAVERILQLFFLYLVGYRAMKSLCSRQPSAASAPATTRLEGTEGPAAAQFPGRCPPGEWSGRSALRLIATGFALWLVFFTPMDLMVSSGNQEWKALASMALIPVLIFCYLYFFYFFPLVMNVTSVSEIMKMARSCTRADRWLPVKVSLAPAALMYLPQALLAAPYPDGREVWLSLASDSLSGIFWALSCYLGLAAGIVLLDEKTWREHGLVPYRKSRLTTLSIQSVGWVSKVLSPGNGMQILAVCILIWAGNFARLSQMSPAPKIQVLSVALNESRPGDQRTGTLVDLRLELSDSKYSFRGFQPLQFRLAGAQRTIVAAPPVDAHIEGEAEDVRFFFPHRDTALVLNVQFITERKSADLVRLEDLYLWYGGVKIQLLDMKSAQITG